MVCWWCHRNSAIFGTTSLNKERNSVTIRMQASTSCCEILVSWKSKGVVCEHQCELYHPGKKACGSSYWVQGINGVLCERNVKTWTHEIHQLTEIATSQPHAASAAFIHGLGVTYKGQSQISTTYSYHLKMPSTSHSSHRSPVAHHAQNWPGTDLSTGEDYLVTRSD